MRKLFAVLAVLIAAAVGFAISTLKAEVAREAQRVAEAVQRASGREVTFGGVGIALLPTPAIEVRDVTLADLPAFGDTPALEASRVRVRPRWLPMLIGRARVSRVEVEGAALHVVRVSPTHTNLSGWLSATVEKAGVAAGAPVELAGGVLVYEDRTGSPVAGLELRDLSARVERFAGDGRVRVELYARPEGAGVVRVTADVVAGAGPGGGAKVDLDYGVADVDVAALRPLMVTLDGFEPTGVLQLRGSGHGFLGGTSTEVVPAEPLKLTAAGTVGLRVYGLEAPLAFDLALQVRQDRIVVEKGDLSWSGVETDVQGWTRHTAVGEVSLRASFEQIDAAAILARYGVAQSWLPHTALSGQIRVAGPADTPRFRYEASTPWLKMDVAEGYDLEIQDLHLAGILLSYGTDVSAAAKCGAIRLGSMSVPSGPLSFRIGRDKVGAVLAKRDMWDGVGTITIGLTRGEQLTSEVSVLFDDVDAQTTLHNIFPSFAEHVDGHVDTILQLGHDADGLWGKGRIGVHRGTFAGLNLQRAVLAAVAAVPGVRGLDALELAGAHPQALQGEDTHFRSIHFDFQTRDEGYEVGGVRMQLADGEVRARGLLDRSGVLAAGGDLSLSEDLTRDVVARVPHLAPLVAPDGHLHVPIQIEGPLTDLRVRPDDAFLALVRDAAVGVDVRPSLPMDLGPGLGLELPTLDETYYR